MAYSIIDPEYLKPANFLLIVLILVTGGVGLITFLIYLAEQRRIPILVFDGVWSNNLHDGIEYYVKVKRKKGEGRAMGVQGFVGIKNKSDQNAGRWLSASYMNEKETEITKHDYLVLFSTFYSDGKKYINLPGIEIKEPEKINEYTLYDTYKEDKLIVEIEAIRGRIKNKQFVKKIDDIVHESKQIIF